MAVFFAPVAELSTLADWQRFHPYLSAGEFEVGLLEDWRVLPALSVNVPVPRERDKKSNFSQNRELDLAKFTKCSSCQRLWS